MALKLLLITLVSEVVKFPAILSVDDPALVPPFISRIPDPLNMTFPETITDDVFEPAVPEPIKVKVPPEISIFPNAPE